MTKNINAYIFALTCKFQKDEIVEILPSNKKEIQGKNGYPVSIWIEHFDSSALM